MFIDSNGRLGSMPSEFVGTLDAQSEDARGEALRLHARQHSLLILNTFYDAGKTWRHSSGKLSRIDYILVDKILFDITNLCRTMDDIHLTHAEHNDHYLLLARASIRRSRDSKTPPSSCQRQSASGSVRPFRFLMQCPDRQTAC